RARAPHAPADRPGAGGERHADWPGHRGRHQARLLQDRQHRRHDGQHCRVQAVPRRVGGVRVQVGRHVQRAQQHCRAHHRRRLRGRGHRRRPLPRHHVPGPHAALRGRPCVQDAAAAGRGRRRRGVQGRRGRARQPHHQARGRLVHRHLRRHVRDRGAVRPRRRAGQLGPRDRRRQERRHARRRHPRARHLRGAAGAAEPGLLRAGAAGRHCAAARARGPQDPHRLRLGPGAGPGAQARVVRVDHLRRPRPGAAVRRHAHLRRLQGGHRHRRRAVAAVVQAPPARLRLQVHRDGADADRRPRPRRLGRPQHHSHCARRQGPDLVAVLGPADHRRPLRRRAGRRRRPVLHRLRQGPDRPRV
ncbi:hypothetical protein H4R23_006824, partial [Coemansia sp. Cherry 401B]